MDTLLVTPADLHCGSTSGLIPPNWNLKHGGTYHLTTPQLIRWRLWTEAWQKVGEQRKRKKLIVVLNGDLIDGDHHGTSELVTKIEEEQIRMAIECIDTALKLAKFGKGDKLFVIEGTESHTNGGEEAIARDLDAVPALPGNSDNDGRYAHHELRLDINGRLVWIAHHALKVGGREWTKENPLMSDLRNIYFERLEAGKQVPDLVIGAHFHRYTTGQLERNGHTLRGVILPPMQNRTRFARRVVPNQSTRMGLCWHEITKDGLITRYDYVTPNHSLEEIGVIKL